MAQLISEHFGSQKVITPRDIVLRTGEYADPRHYAFNREVTSVPLDDYIDQLNGHTEFGYAGNIDISWKEFNQIIEVGLFSDPEYSINPRMWLGPKGAITPLHVDAADNLAFHSIGRKRWTLFPPTEFAQLHMVAPWPDHLAEFHVSQLDLRIKLHRSHLRKTLNRKMTEVTLGPNEVLYLPQGWSHFVESLSTAVLFNTWFVGNPLQLLLAPTRNVDFA